MTWQMATVLEHVCDGIPDSLAIIDGSKSLRWREYENRAARFAAALTSLGLVKESKFSIYANNCSEYLEAYFAGFKARMCPVNINYRYQAEELMHVIENSDSEVLIYQARFADKVEAIRNRLPKLRALIEIDDGSGNHVDASLDYATLVRDHAPAARITRSGQDLYMMYTGGTTGLPKGVVYDHETFARSFFQRGFQRQGYPVPQLVSDFSGVVAKLAAAGKTARAMPACPFMHGTGMWLGVLLPFAMGGAVILFDNLSFDAHEFWRIADKNRATEVTIAGDVFAKPMLRALEAAIARGEAYDLSHLKVIRSSGVMFSVDVKRSLLDYLDLLIIDSIGSSEGALGVSMMSRSSLETGETGTFTMLETTKVFTENGREVAPGSDEVGLLCQSGIVPLEYYKDPEKSAETFRSFGGTRYSVPGDFAKIDKDGNIVLLGRGAMCINTGGEKVFPEEVEEAIKSHPAVYDCLVVGLSDDRFGERVGAVLSVAAGQELDLEDLDAHLRKALAGYKRPRVYAVTDTVPRADNGKADYPAAHKIASRQTDMEGT